MNEQIKENYSIGLDIGTGSVGWAVVDRNYKLDKVHSKTMWGSRLFSTANTAKDTRLNRSVRRRYNKRRERIMLLRGLMNDMVMAIDDSFFIRMEHTSFLDEEDKQNVLEKQGTQYKGNYNLFVDKNYTDRDFYKEYPTIYHLRNKLCTSTEKMDPRLIYLALHHIVKYRGNFLREGQELSLKDNNDIVDVLQQVLEDFSNLNEFRVCDYDSVLEIQTKLKENVTKSLKVENINNILSSSYDKNELKLLKEFFTGVVGNKFTVNKLFIGESFKDNKTKLQFSDDNFDTALEEAGLSDDYIDIIMQMQKVYQWVELMSIVGEKIEGTISTVMIKRFESHKEDLKLLKDIIREYKPNEYHKMFRKENEKGSYKDYIEHPGNTTQEVFYANLTKLLTGIEDNRVDLIKNKIALEEFLVKQNGRTYAAIPYQFQLEELRIIIENQGKYYSDLLKTYNNVNMIESILTFRIPYYYGPLNTESTHGWIIKQKGKENERITPWNHKEVVDIDATAEEFIQRMTNFCTYLPNEKVMPKKSLICQKYEVLAELNKIRIDEKYIALDTKKEAIEQLFLKKKSITDKAFRTWLFNNQKITDVNVKITGYQKDNAFSTNMSSWIDMNKIIGITDDNFNMIEDIIYDMTIFEDKVMLKRKLRKYDLTADQVAKLCKLNYTGWSRLSNKLINGIKCSNRFALYREKISILDTMERSNLALMEIINDEKLGYKAIIDRLNQSIDVNEFSYDNLVKNLAGSPALKRGIWQTLLIIDELVKVKGYAPANIIMEFAREEGEKKRTISAVNALLDQYKEIFNSTDDLDNKYTKDPDIMHTYEELKKQEKQSTIYDRLQLYYMQMGKCMYTGQVLDINKLSEYEIDHIIPQSLVMDNSLDNRVLVISKENQRKINEPISYMVRNKMGEYWRFLFEHKLISPKKYSNLMKANFTDNDVSRFINRQLVETRQITKHVANIIQVLYPDTKVITVRADLSHEFRIKYEIYKSRLLNDYHHAHDAYIAALLGTYIQYRFPKLEAKYVYGEYMHWSNQRKKTEINQNKDGFILNSMNNTFINEVTGEVIWDPSYINSIKKCFYYKDCFVTKKTEEKTGLLFKETVFKAKKNDPKTIASYPVNKFRANVNKYGGYSNIEYCMVAIKGEKPGKKKVNYIAKIAALPLIYKNNSEEEIITYFEQNEQLQNVEIIRRNIPTYQLVEIDGSLLTLASPSEFNTAVQLVLSQKYANLAHFIEHAVDNKKFDDTHLVKKELEDMYSILVKKLYDYYPHYKNVAKTLDSNKDNFKCIDIPTQCNVIYQIMRMMHANAENGNLKIQNFNVGSDRAGRLNSKVVDLTKTYFIYQSVTGIYSKKYKL